MAKVGKRDFRDRKDGIYLKNLDSMHVIMPYVLPHRTANEAVLKEEIDISAIDAFVREKNASGPDFKYTWFHVICAALAKIIVLRPKMNYFITGNRMYSRRDIELAFTIKRQFEDDAEEALAKVNITREGASPLSQVYEKVKEYVTNVRVKDRTEGITNQMNAFRFVPRLLMKFVVWFLRVLEFFGRYPQSMQKDDPCYCSVYVTNLGSIKLSADYHHLYEWGTASFFVVIGEKKLRPVFNDDGSYVMRDVIPISFTIDERIADGYYFSKTIKLLKYILQHPELLDLDIETPVEYE